MHFKTTLAAGLALLLSCSSIQATETNLADTPEVIALKQAFITEQVGKGFSEKEVTEFLANSQS